MRKILIVNDDGIAAPGIIQLASLAVSLGEVTVIAPNEQKSAVSMKINIRKDFSVKKVSFPVPGVRAAYAVDGTPADCVLLAMKAILPEKPDVVFSGINYGWNTAVDILYSGTVGACMEAQTYGSLIPAIAWSMPKSDDYSAAGRYLLPLAEELLANPPGPGEIWNVNFPRRKAEEVRGILRERVPAEIPSVRAAAFSLVGDPEGEFVLHEEGLDYPVPAEGTDLAAVKAGYISVGKLKNMVVGR